MVSLLYVRNKPTAVSISLSTIYLSLNDRTSGCSTKACKRFDGNPKNWPIIDLQAYHTPWTAGREVFTKTLGLCTLLHEYRCAFKSDKFPLTERTIADQIPLLIQLILLTLLILLVMMTKLVKVN